MARYLIDTNILSYLVDTISPFHEAVYGRLAGLADQDEVMLSILSLYELHHWFAYDPVPQAGTQEIIRGFRILPLSETGAELFGALMRDLRGSTSRAAVQRHAIDCMIGDGTRERCGARLQRCALRPAGPAHSGPADQ